MLNELFRVINTQLQMLCCFCFLCYLWFARLIKQVVVILTILGFLHSWQIRKFKTKGFPALGKHHSLLWIPWCTDNFFCNIIQTRRIVTNFKQFCLSVLCIWCIWFKSVLRYSRNRMRIQENYEEADTISVLETQLVALAIFS